MFKEVWLIAFLLVPSIGVAQAATQESSLQEIIHGEVLEGKKGLPRMKSRGIWLVSVDEAPHQIVYTYELDLPQSAINLYVALEMQQEITSTFRNTACRNNQILPLLRRGMTIAQTYRLSETKNKIFTLNLSIRDC